MATEVKYYVDPNSATAGGTGTTNALSGANRYRVQIPAREMGASMNDLTADVLIFAKPQPEEVKEVRRRAVPTFRPY